MMLTMLTAITVSKTASGYLFKKAGEVIKEVLGDNLDDAIKGGTDALDDVVEGGNGSVIYGTDDIANYEFNMIENPGVSNLI